MKEHAHSPVFRILFLDLLLMTFINAIFVLKVKHYHFGSTGIGQRYLLLVILLNLLWILVNVTVTRYRMEIGKSYWQETRKILVNVLVFSGIIVAFAFVFKELKYSRIIVFGTLAAFSVALLLAHLLLLKLFKVWRRKNPVKKKVLIVGNDHSAIDLSNMLVDDKDIDYHVIVYIETEELNSKIDDNLIVGPLHAAQDIFNETKIDELFMVVSSSKEDEIKALAEAADFHGARVRMVPTFFKLFQQDFNVQRMGQIPIINVNEIPLDHYYSALNKRVFDILFSLVTLVLCSPLLLLIALAVKFSSRGPVFYVPRRVGVGGTVFKLFKFRTMVHDADNPEERSTEKDDPRVTSLGKFLRRFNLDELPQFFNVLIGDMSVSGPRPHRVTLDKMLQNSVDKYMVRHYIKPGITGWAQVNGWRGPTQTDEQKIQRTQHDLWYIKNWTFWLDIKIIFLTLLGKKAHKNAF